jgi:hypothetical protein
LKIIEITVIHYNINASYNDDSLNGSR